MTWLRRYTANVERVIYFERGATARQSTGPDRLDVLKMQGEHSSCCCSYYNIILIPEQNAHAPRSFAVSICFIIHIIAHSCVFSILYHKLLYAARGVCDLATLIFTVNFFLNTDCSSTEM